MSVVCQTAIPTAMPTPMQTGAIQICIFPWKVLPFFLLTNPSTKAMMPKKGGRIKSDRSMEMYAVEMRSFVLCSVENGKSAFLTSEMNLKRCSFSGCVIF